MNFEVFVEMQRFVGWTPDDARRMEKLLEWLRPRLQDLSEVFYRTLLEFPEARQVFRDPSHISQLKLSLQDWARKLCTGPYDEAYVRLRSRIGRIHLQIGLPQRYMLTGMSLIRQFLTTTIIDNASSGEEREGAELALQRILDCELAIMLQTYHEDLMGKLGRQERLAALGTVAVTINHELKNPLAVLKTSVDALRRYWGSAGREAEEKAQRHLAKLDRNLTRMQQHISSLLEFARGSEPALAECDVHSVIEEAIEEATMPPGTSLEKRYAPALPLLDLDRGMMARVFVNLASNAYHAMEEKGGKLTIETHQVPGGVRITFRDSGPGVPADLREQIFEPLWTGRLGGTGMGLAICRNLVQGHRGRIWVESPGDGARFHVELPARGESVGGDRNVPAS